MLCSSLVGAGAGSAEGVGAGAKGDAGEETGDEEADEVLEGDGAEAFEVDAWVFFFFSSGGVGEANSPAFWFKKPIYSLQILGE